jgi:hypothetical protein
VFRPQFPFPPAPPGFSWQPCVYQYDGTNTPVLGTLLLSSGQVSGHIPLHTDKDAPFLLMAIRVTGTETKILLLDQWWNYLVHDYVLPAMYGSTIPPTNLEGPWVEVPAGAVLQARFEGV